MTTTQPPATVTSTQRSRGRTFFVSGLALLAAGLTTTAGAVTVLAQLQEMRGIRDSGADGTFDSLRSPTAFQSEAILIPGNKDDRIAIEFDLSLIPNGVTITNATLRLDEDFDNNSQGMIVGLYGYSGDGSISLADATAGSPIIGNLANGSPGITPFDVTGFVQGLHGASQNTAGFRISTSAVQQNLPYRIEGPSPIPPPLGNGKVPELIIDYIPEPSSALLSALGAFAVLGRRRKR